MSDTKRGVDSVDEIVGRLTLLSNTSRGVFAERMIARAWERRVGKVEANASRVQGATDANDTIVLLALFLAGGEAEQAKEFGAMLNDLVDLENYEDMLNDTEIARLRNWSIVCRSDSPYVPPELRFWVFQGEVYGHPSERFPDGDKIVTSAPVAVNWEVGSFETKSGSVYYLDGPPADTWLEYLDENGHSLDDYKKLVG